MLFKTLVKAFRDYRWERRKQQESKRRFKIALAFNTYYTHYDRYLAPKGMGGRWMCPNCNTIHERLDFSLFSGRLYPACCSLEEGPRCYEYHAV